VCVEEGELVGGVGWPIWCFQATQLCNREMMQKCEKVLTGRGAVCLCCICAPTAVDYLACVLLVSGDKPGNGGKRDCTQVAQIRSSFSR